MTVIVKESNPLKQEIETYYAKMPELEKDLDKFVLIKGSEIMGVFPTRGEALFEGYKKIGTDKPFLVKKIMLPGTEPIANFSRDIFTA